MFTCMGVRGSQAQHWAQVTLSGASWVLWGLSPHPLDARNTAVVTTTEGPDVASVPWGQGRPGENQMKRDDRPGRALTYPKLPPTPPPTRRCRPG